MAVQQTTKDLTDSQQDKLVSLLKRIEAADSAQEAVWLDADGREDVREIRQAVEE